MESTTPRWRQMANDDDDLKGLISLLHKIMLISYPEREGGEIERASRVLPKPCHVGVGRTNCNLAIREPRRNSMIRKTLQKNNSIISEFVI